MDHPSLVDLLESSESSEVQEHLASCPPCRARARLLDGLDDLEPQDIPGFALANERLAEARTRASISLSQSYFGEGAALPTDLAPGRVLERYRVVERVARGGMGTVYRVEHTTLGSAQALKVIHRMSTSIHDRVMREGRAQSRLRHPHVVPVTDVLEVDGAPGLIMEFVDGPTLAAYLLEHGQLPVEQIDRLAVQILRGVAAAHAQKIIHRDLKPANVLLAPADDGGLHAKVTDFGLARELDLELDESAQLTGPDRPMGTPSYMAPEQIRDARTADVRSDVWSLGAVLYELATGHRAFPGTDLIGVYDRVRTGRYVPVRDHVPDLPQRMVDAIEGALEVERDLRIPDVRALLDTWNGSAASEPTIDSPSPRVREPVEGEPSAAVTTARPSMWGSLLAAGIAAAAVVGVGASVFLSPSGHGEAQRPLVPPPPAPSRDRQLTALPDDLQIYSASLSADGTTMVFADGRGVWIQPVDGGSARVLLPDVDVQNVHFFPDGERVLVTGRRDGRGGVWAVSLDGRDDRRLASEATMWARVSPQGDRVALADASGLWVTDAEGGGRTRLRPLAAGDGTSGLEWSPSGDTIVACHYSTNGDAPWLELTAADGSSTRRLLEDPRLLGLNLAAMAWLAPDTLVYALTHHEGETPVVEVFALDHAEQAPDTGHARKVHEWTGHFVTRIRPDASGHRVTYSRVTANSSVLLYDLAEGSSRRLSREDWFEQPLGWLDNERVLVRSNRGPGGIYARHLDDREPQLVAASHGVGDWAIPTARGVIYPRVDKDYDRDEPAELLAVRQPLDGSPEDVLLRLPAVKDLTMGLRKRYQIRCSEDLRCIVGQPSGTGVDISWWDVDTGRVGEHVISLPKLAQGAWDLSPDGERLAVLGSTPPMLTVLDLDTNERLVERSVDLHFVRHISWDRDGEGIFAAVLSDVARNPYQLVRIDPASQQIEVLMSSMTAFFPTSYPSPDGSTLVVGEHFFDDDLWLLEGVAWTP